MFASSFAITAWIVFPLLYLVVGAINAKAFFTLRPHLYEWDHYAAFSDYSRRVTTPNYWLILFLVLMWPVSSVVMTLFLGVTDFVKPEIDR